MLFWNRKAQLFISIIVTVFLFSIHAYSDEIKAGTLVTEEDCKTSGFYCKHEGGQLVLVPCSGEYACEGGKMILHKCRRPGFQCVGTDEAKGTATRLSKNS